MATYSELDDVEDAAKISYRDFVNRLSRYIRRKEREIEIYENTDIDVLKEEVESMHRFLDKARQCKDSELFYVKGTKLGMTTNAKEREMIRAEQRRREKELIDAYGIV